MLSLIRSRLSVQGSRSPHVVFRPSHNKFHDTLFWHFVVYNETIKGELNKRLICECRCDEKLKAKAERSTRLVYNMLSGGLEHLKIETRLRNGHFRSPIFSFFLEKKMVLKKAIFIKGRKYGTLSVGVLQQQQHPKAAPLTDWCARSRIPHLCLPIFLCLCRVWHLTGTYFLCIPHICVPHSSVSSATSNSWTSHTLRHTARASSTARTLDTTFTS